MSSGIDLIYLKNYAAAIIVFINVYLIRVLLAVAFLTFFIGVYRYFFLGAANPQERKNGGQFVLWSVIGFVVIFSIWGLVAMLGTTFGLFAGGSAPVYPTL